MYCRRNRLPESSVTVLKRLKEKRRGKSENATYPDFPYRRVVPVFCRSIT